MTYAAPSDIRLAVAPDGSSSGTCAELDDEQLQVHIQSAQALVDAYTGVAFLDWNVPVIIKELAITLGAYYATLAYRKGKALEATHPVYLRYQDAQHTLQGIKSGQLNFEPATRTDTDATPVRAKPKVNNAWRSSAELFPMKDFGMKVVGGEDDNEGYMVTEDPATSNTGFA